MSCVTIPNKLITMGIKELSKDKFQEVKNKKEFVKPYGGLWSCPYTPSNKYVSAWHEWCSDEMPNWLSNDSVILTLKEDARYWCIDNQDDLESLIEIVGEQESIMSKQTDFKFATYIDFEKAKELFDVIYLTANGAIETHIPFDRSELNLYGWDCESCLILNYDCIENWEYKKLDIKEEE